MTLNTLKSLAAVTLIATAVAAAAAGTAMAEQHTSGSDAVEAQMFLAAPGSIADAISAAEKGTGGRAMSAAFEPDDTTQAAAWEVELALPDNTVKTVMVDPTDGKVTAKAAEAEDQDGAAGDSGENEDGENDSN